MCIDYAALDALAQRLMKDRKAHLMREKGFVYGHGKRVAVGVIALRGMITQDGGHDDGLRIAAMFHDVGKGIEPHGQSGAALAREMLREQLDPALLGEVAFYIAEHTNREAADPFAKILQDADVLDHFGSLEIGLAFQYGAYNEEGMRATALWYRDAYGPYVERTLRKLNHPQSKAILEDKVAFTLAFARRFEAEWKGLYVAPGEGPGRQS